MRYMKIPALLTALLCLTSCGEKYGYVRPQTADVTDYTRESAGIRLEDDYYGYRNFDFLMHNDIPADMNEYSFGQIVGRQVEDILTDEITAIAESDKKYPDGSDEQKIKDLYLQYLDTDTRNSVGIKPLEKGLELIENARSIDEFVQACGAVRLEYGCTALPEMYCSQDIYDSGSCCVCMGQAELFYRAEELLCGRNVAEELQKNMLTLLEALGSENADKLAYDAVTMLLDIAENTSDIYAMRTDERYNRYGRSELSELLSNIDVPAMLESFGVGEADSVVVYDPAQIERVNLLLTEENLPVWKALEKCALVYEYKEYLPQQYSGAIGFGGGRSEEQKAVGAVEELLAEELGRIYARKYADERTLAAVTDMVEDIRGAYRKCIEGSELLEDDDRAEYLAKIDGLTLKIGFPAEEHHSGSVVSGSLLESVISIKGASVGENLALANGRPSRNEWSIAPQTFNALYETRSNSITVPLAMINAPFFDIDADYYTNLGGLGTVIAHEIGHAFDPEGIMYDEFGCCRPERLGSERLDRLTAETEEYFGSKRIMDTFYINGRQTMLENAADLGGMQVIASMTDKPDELRLIFESYANIWATLSFDTSAAFQIADDEHSPAEVRVNAVLSSVDKFYEAYDIGENDGMYLPFEERVRVW